MGIFNNLKNLFNKEKSTDKEVMQYEKSLSKTRDNFVSKLINLTNKYKSISDDYFDELEEILISADIGVNTVLKFIDKLKQRVKEENITSLEEMKEVIVDELFIIYVNNNVIVNKINYSKTGPTVILFVGVNGVGKTTTIAKLAFKEKSLGKKVMLIAGDTFRAGAVKQLKEWALRLGVNFYG
ncbi:MAG: signal recognition particle receptor subunit alpha, partial [Bacilli bacterium]